MESLNTSEVIRMTGISPRKLYYWERKGIIMPELVQCGSRQYRRYTDEDTHILRRIRHMRSCGYSLQGIARRLNGGE